MFKKLVDWIKGLFTKIKPFTLPKVYTPSRVHRWDRDGNHILRKHHFGTFSPIRPIGWRRQAWY